MAMACPGLSGQISSDGRRLRKGKGREKVLRAAFFQRHKNPMETGKKIANSKRLEKIKSRSPLVEDFATTNTEGGTR